MFQCEVSEDAPLFHTDIRASKMQVVELPNDEPRLNLEKKSISPSDNLKATCQVGTSFPAANITWFINGKKVRKKFTNHKISELQFMPDFLHEIIQVFLKKNFYKAVHI